MPALMSDHPVRAQKLKAVVPARFHTAPATLWIDRAMTQFIKIGGIAVIGAVSAIFLFILIEILPLFRRTEVEALSHFQLDRKRRYVAMGVDEWSELPFVADQEGFISFIDLEAGGAVRKRERFIPPGREASVVRYKARNSKLIYGTNQGEVGLVDVAYKPSFSDDGTRTIVPSISTELLFQIGRADAPVIEADMGAGDDKQLIAAIQDFGDQRGVSAVRFTREHTLFGSGEAVLEAAHDLSGSISGTPERVLVNSHGDEIVVSTQEGEVYVFFQSEDGYELRQVFIPFGDTSDPFISSIEFILGDVSLSLANAQGFNRVYSLFVPPGGSERTFGLTKRFKELPAAPTFYDASLRNKAFLIGSGRYASLRYATTESIRWEETLPFKVEQGIISGKYNRLLFLDRGSRLHLYRLEDAHPESGFKAFFSPLWYEGYSEPGYEWQSSGGTDDFEPKLSLVPLVLGSLKGTVYALLFALPISLLAALYTSQFAHQRFRFFVKPSMEIMASLPSVVLGFLAALWLAPLIEARVPSLLMAMVTLPIVSFGMGLVWTSLPMRYRRRVKPGYEWIGLLPVLALFGCLAWASGPLIERWCFTVADPETGRLISDFRLWWPEVSGTAFEQRNSLVVGFTMGFAVIPIIFTIAEDALSNVPQAVRSASLALGASRWQTAFRVVLPMAFPGIFSAAMIGFGRAVGETMIVVMATGNTPIMDFNIFSGMRTLSANIAVELPEAPHQGTLYRTLFLGAMILFILTFIVNTGAEIIRQRLRSRYAGA